MKPDPRATGSSAGTTERIEGRLRSAVSFDKQKGVVDMNATEEKKPVPNQSAGGGAAKTPGLSEKKVGPLGITSIIVYLIALSLLSIYGLIQFLPDPAAGTTGKSTVSFLFRTFEMNEEVRLFITVAMAGLLGSLVHALRSLYWYVGNRELNRSWMVKYILMPFVGTVLGLAFYLIIRGGFFSAEAQVNQTNPYGFTALAVLIGMFSEQAALKLKSIAETLFVKPPQGENPKPQEESQGTAKPKEPAKPAKGGEGSPQGEGSVEGKEGEVKK